MLVQKLNKKGFTLLEMLVVVVIITIMSIMTMRSYTSQRKTKEMQFAVQGIADNIRKTQNYSINIKKFEDYDISGGYGIHFESSASSYAIFLDVVKDKSYSSVEDELVDTINLSQGVEIFELNGGAVSTADVVFEPPYGNVSVSFGGVLQSPTPSVSIGVKRSDGSCPENCRTVIINSQGQIKITE